MKLSSFFDSLNRLSLESYGSQSIKTPNFKRLSERCVTFDVLLEAAVCQLERYANR